MTNHEGETMTAPTPTEQATLDRFEAAEPAPESFDAVAALRRVSAVLEQLERDVSEHEVTILHAHAATCSCGWMSTAVKDHDAKHFEADAHMYEHYSVFVESQEGDGGDWLLCWGKP